jgi:hypothetical protein
MSNHVWFMVIIALAVGYVAARFFPQPAALIGLP